VPRKAAVGEDDGGDGGGGHDDDDGGGSGTKKWLSARGGGSLLLYIDTPCNTLILLNLSFIKIGKKPLNALKDYKVAFNFF
jgi:hypothetical protein